MEAFGSDSEVTSRLCHVIDSDRRIEILNVHVLCWT